MKVGSLASVPESFYTFILFDIQVSISSTSKIILFSRIFSLNSTTFFFVIIGVHLVTPPAKPSCFSGGPEPYIFYTLLWNAKAKSNVVETILTQTNKFCDHTKVNS